MVMVHGFSQNSGIFSEQVRFFRDRFRLVLVDLRGHGESPHDGPFGVEEYADDVEDVFRVLSLREVIFWGTHTGTAVGLALYFRNPSFFSRLILEGTVIPGVPTPDIARNIDRAKRVARESGLEQAREDWLMNAEWFSHMNADPERTRFGAHKEIVARFAGCPWLTDELPRKATNLTERIQEIDIPVLTYNGEYDMREFLDMADKMREAVKNIRMARIPDAGGFPLWENPSAVNQLVDNWLRV
jgi:pimeloyl-ACP methyl ester carboxylesterase